MTYKSSALHCLNMSGYQDSNGYSRRADTFLADAISRYK